MNFNKYRPPETSKGAFMKAIKVAPFGAPEVLMLVDVPDPIAGSAEAVIAKTLLVI